MNENKQVEEIKQEVAYFMQRLYNKGLTTSLGGNISCRVNENTYAITSSQSDKARITGYLIGLVRADGTSLNPEVKLSMETFMHLAVYNKRPEINAIVHAHPPLASFFAVSGKKLNCRLSGEGRAMLGEPVYAPYALMGSKELAGMVSKASLKSNVIIMQNHGIITMADSLIVAFDRLEVAEFTARLTILTSIQNCACELTEEQLLAIDNLIKS
jgi:L-fuculose-phosphate aldolase